MMWNLFIINRHCSNDVILQAELSIRVPARGDSDQDYLGADG
jgi:hypothetical protein